MRGNARGGMAGIDFQVKQGREGSGKEWFLRREDTSSAAVRFIYGSFSKHSKQAALFIDFVWNGCFFVLTTSPTYTSPTSTANEEHGSKHEDTTKTAV